MEGKRLSKIIVSVSGDEMQMMLWGEKQREKLQLCQMYTIKCENQQL